MLDCGGAHHFQVIEFDVYVQTLIVYVRLFWSAVLYFMDVSSILKWKASLGRSQVEHTHTQLSSLGGFEPAAK